MFRKVQNFCVSEHKIIFQQVARNITSSEISTALRPFYFSVHPDLFGQHPDQRATNESSLQTLSSIIEKLQTSKSFQPVNLEFYVKDRAKEEITSQSSIRLIKISVREKDVRSAILNILKSCQLPTEYIENIKSTEDGSRDGSPRRYNYRETRNKYTNDYDFMDEESFFSQIWRMQKEVKDERDIKLDDWLRKNFESAREKSTVNVVAQEEIERLTKKLIEKLGLEDIRWECGWNNAHFRGCLLAFQSLSEQHPEHMHVLKGRILVFSYFTGVSLDAHVMLFSGEVRNNWLDFIKKIKQHDETLKRIPAFEKSLSHILRNIKIGRRKFMPKVSGGEYEKHLTQLTTSLSDYFGYRSFPKDWPESLKEYEIVVDNEAGPLMVSPTGQFIVPSTIPGTQLVSFISSNLIEAAQKASEYKSNKHIERSLCKLLKEQLRLSSITKEDNITPDIMIQCCRRLLENKHKFKLYTEDLQLNIASYYSVQADGVVCIPWNFKN